MREQTQKEDDGETIERMLVEAFHDCLPIGETAPFYAALTRALALQQAQVSSLRAEQTRLREALATYGFHSSSCAAWARAPWREEDCAMCDCGLAAALSSTPTPETTP